MADTKNCLKFVVLLNVINITIIVAGAFMMPLWADFVTHIGGDLRTAGNAIFIFSIVIGIVTFIAGKVESHFDLNEHFILVAQLVMLMAYLGYFFVQHPYQLYIIQIVLGVGGAFQAPALCSLYQRFIPSENNNAYWGVWAGFYNISVGIGALTSAYVSHHYSYTVVFSVLCSVSVVGVFICGLLIYQVGILKQSMAYYQLTD